MVYGQTKCQFTQSFSVQSLDQMTTATEQKSTGTGVGNQCLVPRGWTQHWNKQ